MTEVEQRLIEKNIPHGGYPCTARWGITKNGEEEFIFRQRGYEPPVREFYPRGTVREMDMSAV